MDELHYQPAHELLKQLEAGTLTSEQLVIALLARIREHNPAVNAIVTLDETRVLEEALEADRKRSSGTETGPLHGLPLTLKDTWEVAGMTCTAGASALRDYKPERHADVVQRLEDAGAIILGKTNVPVYATDLQSYNKLFGVTNNPAIPITLQAARPGAQQRRSRQA